jgi:carboxypeptidase family protein/TonB-dependent receptor-like protein
MSRAKLLVVALILALTPTMLMAQGFQVGNISGVASDQTGGALPGVSITVTHTERGLNRTEVTDAQGRYRFAGLPLGTYRLEATLEGFAPTLHNVRVEADKTNTIDVTMSLAAATEAITVTAEAPVVDPTNTTTTTRLSTEEYEKAPIGRSFQTIASFSPGISRNGGGNPNANGALSSSNQYVFDGVDVTDPTTGTFGANINFEAIQEVNVLTTGLSAEYGRATGAVVSVITKSGTNDFEGSAKLITSNDDWNAQNKSRNQVTGASLARTKNDHVNKRYTGTLGGPLWRDHLWFFGAYEEFKPVAALARTTVTGQEYGSAANEKFQNYRVNWQITPSHQVWAKWNEDPITGITRTYIEATDIYTLTSQGQGGQQKNAQYSGVFGSNFSVDATYGKAESTITVTPYATGPFDNGALILDYTSNKYYNGGIFGDGNFVGRPREQWNVAGTYFSTLGGNSHEFKVGVDSQEFESTSYYTITNNRQYDVENYNAATGTFTPLFRYDFEDPGPQTSTGDIKSLYARDKFSIGRRFNAEVGLRFEQQAGQNDAGRDIIDAAAFAPRFGLTYDLFGNGSTLLTASAGRFNGWILQSFSDAAAQGLSRTNYSGYEYNPATGQYDFIGDFVQPSGAQFPVNLDLDPDRMDEVTFGVQRQLAGNAGVTVRGIYRKWDNFVEDRIRFVNNAPITEYYNNSDLERDYKAVQAVFDKRFSNNWSLYANYTYSQVEGNQFSTFNSVNDDYFDVNCRSTADTSIGTIPCSQAISTLNGRPNFDVPHVANLLSTYGMNLGRVNLTFGGAGSYRSGYAYSKTTSVRPINPNNTAQFIGSSSYTYYFEGLGSERLPSVWSVDGSVEATFGVWHNVEVGVKGEVFNLLNRQEQIDTTLTAWCNESNTSAACATNRARHGLATGTTQFQSPRSFRFTTLLRF